MTVLIPLVAFALLTLILAFWAFRGGPQIRNLSELEQHADPVELRLLANLVDPVQERFVRERLSRLQFFQFKIMRFRAANRYIACISRNAALFLSIGRSAAKNPAPEIAVAGHQLAEAALRVRLYAHLARLSLAVQILYPSPFSSLTLLMRNYDTTKARITHLRMLQSSGPTLLRYR
jgi:hypothetical protein